MASARSTGSAGPGARRHPKRVNELAARQARLWKRELRPALAAAGHRDHERRGVLRERAREARAYFERDIYPILTPLAVGPGQPFPYISGLSLSLGVIALDPETDEERFARVKVPEGLDRFVPVGQEARAARSGDRPFPPDAVPRHGDHRARALPRDARRGLRGLRRRRRPPRGRRDRAPAAADGRRRPARALELGVAGDARPARDRARRAAEPGLRGRGAPRPGRPLAARRARPPGSRARPVDARRAAALGARQDAARGVRGDPPWRPDRPPALRLVPRELRVVRARRRPTIPT